ncbi:MAG: hypothetical protein RRB13_10705 [bacterium]|nr:hypothetical protein [bacterium]
MNPKDLAQTMARARPELGGYSQLSFAQVEQVHSRAGQHERLQPLACVDLTLLDHQMQPKAGFAIIEKVPLVRASRHVSDPPRAGDRVLLAFVEGLANSAVVLAILHDQKEVNPQEGVLELSGADQIILGASASTMDQAVLAKPLTDLLTLLWNCLDAIGQNGGSGTNTPVPGYATLTANATQFNQLLEDMKSQIKLGELTKS